MQDKVYKTLRDELRKEAQRAKSYTREEALESLYKSGIVTKNGNLRKMYRSPE